MADDNTVTSLVSVGGRVTMDDTTPVPTAVDDPIANDVGGMDDRVPNTVSLPFARPRQATCLAIFLARPATTAAFTAKDAALRT